MSVFGKQISRGKQCCVFDCFNKQYSKENEILKDLHFFRIPKSVLKSKTLKNRWSSLIKRQDGRDGFNFSSARICSEHFLGPGVDINVSDKTGNWLLKPNVEPSVFSWTQNKSQRKPPKERLPFTMLPSKENITQFTFEENLHAEPEYTAVRLGNSISTQTEHIPPILVDTACQTDNSTDTCTSDNLNSSLDHSYSFRDTNDENNIKDTSKYTDSEIREQLRSYEIRQEKLLNKISRLKEAIEEFEQNQFTIEKISDDKSAMMFYTGFPNIETFNSFYEYLEDKVDRLNYWRGKNEHADERQHQTGRKKTGKKRELSAREELFIVLLRLKVGLFVRDIAERFRISPGQFSKIFTTWINFLSCELPLLFPFPSQAKIRRNMPEEFSKYPMTRIILDCTEIYIEVPSSMLTQSQTWSNYKHHNTFKVLVGVSPNGCLTFVSDLWGGRVTDKEITKKSGILDLLEAGDNVMADRGFDIKDILPEGVGLNIPPFKGERNQLTALEVEETMSIASVRIHVEREIGRIKNYHILDGVLPLSLSHIAGHIFKVIGYLTNFLPPLVPPAPRPSCSDGR